MTTHIRIGQFAIVDREPVDRGPNAGVFRGKGPLHDRAELYVVAEATNRAGEAFAGHVVSSLGQLWQSLDMSLTGSLREIYREADANVREWNKKSLNEYRIELGMACLARRGDQTVAAVGGPAIAFHSTPDGCSAYYPDEAHARPLGSGTVEPVIQRLKLVPGNRFLMVSSSVLGVIEPDLLADILALEPDRILREVYHHVASLRDVTVMLAVAEEQGDASSAGFDLEIKQIAPELAGEVVIDATQPPEPTGPSLIVDPIIGSPQSSQRREHGARSAMARQELQEIEKRARVRVPVPGDYVLAPTPLRRVSGEASAERLAAAGRAAADGRRPQRPEASTRSRSFSRGLVRAPVPPPPSRNDLPLAEDAAREVVARQSQQIRHNDPPPMDAMASSRTLVRPRDGAGARMRGSGALSARSGRTVFHVPSWMIAVAGVVALLGLVAAYTLPGMLREQESGRYLSLIDQAQQHYTNALVMEDPGDRRAALRSARGLLIEAQQLPGAGAEAEQLTAAVTELIDNMNAVLAPAAIETVASLTEFGDAPVTASELAIAAGLVYLLDGNGGQVIAISVAGGEARSVFSATTEGVVGRPQAIAAGVDPESETVLIAGVNQQLWSYSAATGLRTLDLPLPEGGDITDITTDGGNLYVLDAAAATIYSFAPSTNGFAQRATVFRTPQLAAARRLLVRGDEAITTDADGTLRWFSGEITLELALGGIDQPLVSPEPVQALGDGGEFAIADPANARVVVFQRDGTFSRQYQAPELEALQGLVVSGDTSYVFSGGVLLGVTWDE